MIPEPMQTIQIPLQVFQSPQIYVRQYQSQPIMGTSIEKAIASQVQSLSVPIVRRTIPIVINTPLRTPKILLITTTTAATTSTASTNQTKLIQSPNPDRQNQSPDQLQEIANNTTNATIISGVPFLPGPVANTVSVKNNLTAKSVSVENSNIEAQTNYQSVSTNLSRIDTTTTTPANILTNTNTNYCPNISNQSNQQNRNHCPNLIETVQVLSPATIRTVNQMQSMDTLASMAGIQLTEAEESQRADMSGAMPIATVEEMNVPVFLDEYLPQSASATASNTNSNNNHNNNSSSNNNNNVNCVNGNRNDNGNENDNCNEIYIGSGNGNGNGNGTAKIVNSDFGAIPENDQNYILSESGEFLSVVENINDNNNNISIVNNDINVYDNNSNMSNCNTIQFASNNWSFADSDRRIDNDDDFTTEALFQILYNGENNDFLSQTPFDSLSQNIDENIDLNTYEAIDFNDNNNNDDLTQYLRDYKCDLPLTHNAILDADSILLPNVKTEILKIDDENSWDECNGTDLKRKATDDSDDTHTIAKRRKFELNITVIPQGIITEPHPIIDTPTVIRDVIEMSTNQKTIHYSNAIDIANELMNVSNSSYPLTDVQSPLGDSNQFNDDDERSTGTPQSGTSSLTNQTVYTCCYTSPSSPAFSVATNSPEGLSHHNHRSARDQRGDKRKRGRPSKQHSDQPDPEVLSKMSESERKRLEDRAKNNEASRLSRLKNKEREESEKKEEIELSEANRILNDKYAKLEREEQQLKAFLEENFKKMTLIKH